MCCPFLRHASMLWMNSGSSSSTNQQKKARNSKRPTSSRTSTQASRTLTSGCLRWDCIPDTCVPILAHQCAEDHLKVWCMFVVSQVEALLASEDYGKDLASVNNLLKKHQLLEADISAHEVCGSAVPQGTTLFHKICENSVSQITKYPRRELVVSWRSKHENAFID